jgi:hypothetical protein
MDCKMFTEFNGTHNNTLTHFYFPEEYENVNLEDSSMFDETYDDSVLLFKRIDSNK